MFDQFSGLKINLHKSELYCYGKAKECEEDYAIYLRNKTTIFYLKLVSLLDFLF